MLLGSFPHLRAMGKISKMLIRKNEFADSVLFHVGDFLPSSSCVRARERRELNIHSSELLTEELIARKCHKYARPTCFLSVIVVVTEKSRSNANIKMIYIWSIHSGLLCSR